MIGRSASLLCLWALVYGTCGAAVAQTSGDDDATGRSSLRFEERPVVRLGRHVRLDLRLKSQLDARNFVPDLEQPPDNDDTWQIGRFRVGLEGRITRFVEFEVEREIRDVLGEKAPTFPWKDVYLRVRPSRLFEARIGKFKIPFGLEQTTSSTNLAFVERARISDAIAPAREIGVEFKGRLLRGDRLNYEAGAFRHDGENSYDGSRPTSGRTYAARVTGTPLRAIRSVPSSVRQMQLGVAAVRSQAFESEGGLKAETVFGKTFFPRIFVQGERLRLGAQLSWTSGPLRLESEFVSARQERRGQSVRVEDLSDLTARGWYATGMWTVWSRKDRMALEVGSRFEVLRVSSRDKESRPSRSPRAMNVLQRSDRVWTTGANVLVRSFVKVQVNGVREVLEDPQTAPIRGRLHYWSVLARLQFVM